MSFFAVAHAAAKPQFAIERCHINLFALRRFGQYDFVWDVGLLVTPVEGVRDVSFELALPFGTEEKCFEDLSSKVLNQSIATQIFGERVVVNDQQVQVPSYGDAFTAIAVRKEGASRLEKSSNDARSLWQISARLAAQGRSYLRLRFQVLRPSWLWQWYPNRWIRNVAYVDFRVSDIRGADSTDLYALSDRIAPIPYLNAFVIAPIELAVVSAYPTIKYARLIERAPWQLYLDREFSSRLAVLHWKENKGAIDRDNPFRGFLELRLGAQTFSTGDIARLAAAAALLVTIVLLVARVPNGVEPFFREKLGSAFAWVTGAAFGLIVTFIARVQWLLGLWTVARTQWREWWWSRKR